MVHLKEDDKTLILVRLLSSALRRARANWSAEDVSGAIYAEVDLFEGESSSEYSMITFLAWAIPSIGFIGTVLGIGLAMGAMKEVGKGGDLVAAASKYLATAFDTTFLALVLSIILMFYMHWVQGREDALLTAAKEYCLDRFVFRMHIEDDKK